jgi:transposase
VLKVEDWAEIRRLAKSEGLSIKEIARRLEVARNTVRSALRSSEPPTYRRERRGSIVDAVEPQIRELLAEFPRMPATVIAERIGWTRGLTQLKVLVRELRPVYLPPDPCQRTDYAPGELAQWDLWFPPVAVPVGADQAAKLPVIVGVSGYSRWIVARMIPSREVHDILGGHLACLGDLGAVPRKGVYDNEAALVSRHGGRVTLSAPFQAFRGTLGMGVIVCRPGDPEAKGLVERANRYLETSFLPGRTFTDVENFNVQLRDWLARANHRTHRGLQCRPADRIAEDRSAMLRFPPVLPNVALRFSTRLGRDHCVRVHTCDYSVHPRVIGRRVEVRVELEWVVVTCDGAEVARHRRSRAKHRTVVDPSHGRARRALRDRRALIPAPDDDVEERDLADYDQALGVA